MSKEYTINDLKESSWFPFDNRVTIRKYITSGELKSTTKKMGGLMVQFRIREDDAIEFANKIKEGYKKRFNI